MKKFAVLFRWSDEGLEGRVVEFDNAIQIPEELAEEEKAQGVFDTEYEARLEIFRYCCD